MPIPDDSFNVANDVSTIKCSGRSKRLGVVAHTKGFATNFPALVAHFVPGASVHLIGSITQLAGQRDDFGNDKLSNATGIGKG